MLACLAALCLTGPIAHAAPGDAAKPAAPANGASPGRVGGAAPGAAGEAARPRAGGAAAGRQRPGRTSPPILRGLQPRLAPARAARRQAPALPDPLPARLRADPRPGGAARRRRPSRLSRAGSRDGPASARARGRRGTRRTMRLVVFDVDGTLVDSQHLIVAAQEVAFAENGLPAPEPARGAVGGRPVAAAGVSPPRRRGRPGRGALGELQAGLQPPARWIPRYEEPLFPGMADLLAKLRARDDVLIGLATGKSRRGVDRLIAHHGWADWFATTQSADDAPVQARSDHAAAGHGRGRLRARGDRDGRRHHLRHRHGGRGRRDRRSGWPGAIIRRRRSTEPGPSLWSRAPAALEAQLLDGTEAHR